MGYVLTMPHKRHRHLDSWLTKLIHAAPSISLIGQRQTGKTTLLERRSSSVWRLDKEEVLFQFEREKSEILSAGPFPILIDEAQKCPPVFDDIKGLVDEKRIPGRYLLTGSVRFSAKTDIRESLTGRTLVLELLPLGLAESHGRPLSEVWSVLFQLNGKITEKALEKIEKNSWATEKICQHFLKAGGLPGICFSRDELYRSALFEAHVDTLLGRDLQSIYPSKLQHTRLREMLRMIAAQQGLPLNQAQIARTLSTTSPTVAAHLRAFEALFLIRSLGKGYYLEDQGTATQLLRLQEVSPLSNLRRFVFQELQQQVHYRFRSDAEITTRQPTQGASIPFILRHVSKIEIAILLEESDRPSDGLLKTASWYLKSHSRSIAVILHKGKHPRLINSRTIAIPYNWII